MRTSFNILALGLVSILLVACAEVQVFEDTRREAGQREPVGLSQPDKPAICYNPLWHEITEAQTLADSLCAPNHRVAVLKRTEAFSCRLMTPTTLFYECVLPQKQPSARH